MAKTVNIPSQIVVQTAAAWAADATVYSAKRLLITSDAYYGATDQRKFKIADGVQTWSNLDYFPLDDKVYAVDFGNINNWAPADLTSYYFGLSATIGTATTVIAFVPLYAGKVVAIVTETFSASTIGTGEDGTLTFYYNDGANSTVIASDFKLNANRHTTRNFTGLNIDINSGSAYFKFDTPSYATNPTAIQLRITLIIRP